MPLFFLLIFNILWLTGYNSYNLNSNLIPKSVNTCTSANDAITLQEQHAVRVGNIVFLQLNMKVTEELPIFTALVNIPYSCHPSIMETYVKDIEFYIIGNKLSVRSTLPVGNYWISFIYPTLE